LIIDLPVASRKILAKPTALGWFLSLGGAGYTKLNFLKTGGNSGFSLRITLLHQGLHSISNYIFWFGIHQMSQGPSLGKPLRAMP